MEKNSIWGQVIRPYKMPLKRSVNIDSELDLKLVELIMQEQRQGANVSETGDSSDGF
jgi:CMP-N-acetylneuraminic acid synthetase